MGRNYEYVTYLQKIKGNKPNLDLANINAYTKFGESLSNWSQDIESKRKYDTNQAP